MARAKTTKPRRTKGTPLTSAEATALSGYLAVSNMGMDDAAGKCLAEAVNIVRMIETSPFRPSPTGAATRIYGAGNRGGDMDDLLWTGLRDEADAWFNGYSKGDPGIKRETREKIRRVWPDVAKAFWPNG